MRSFRKTNGSRRGAKRRLARAHKPSVELVHRDKCVRNDPGQAAVLFALAVCDAGAGETGLFVAVGYGGRRITSRDGLAWENDQRWSDEAKDNDDVLFDVAFGAGRFIAGGGGAQTGHILSTRDGRDWKSVQDVKGRVADMECLPPSLAGRHYYTPTGEGRERALAQRMEEIRRIRAEKRESE